MDSLGDAIDEARRLGRLEGERFDLELREAERRAREERLSRIAFGAEPDGAPGRESEPESSATVTRLQRDVQRLAAFHDAVLRSKAWRVIQALRRPFGRSW